MDFGGGIDDQSEMWGWQSQEFDLQKDLLPAPSSSLWAEANSGVDDDWSMFDEQTPIRQCTDIDFQFCDIGDVITKDFDEGKETLQAKRRRMLQFCPESVQMECPLADGLSENLQVNLDFSSDEVLLNCEGTDELPEQWLVDFSQDSDPRCLPEEEANSPTSTTALVKANISALRDSLAQEQSNGIEKKPLQGRSTPLKAGKNIIRARKVKTSVAYPFELIKPCGFHGGITLREINQKIHAPPPHKIRHKSDEGPASYQASAISGKPVVHKTKIHTEGRKGTITITRTMG
ncbi:protein XRI1 [Brachypodium distachyon]|uniref:Protein XRI1 n=1 Tax=Brachypodium distachyon TaxID=15368 RepID=I1HUL4_BRADI|nr:protein XRI1 [Brachypodium distachyon]KQK11214.1 hypothetical protein BRADI_2g58820v3 [Brachypodium distachyon]|eukprot:XP_003564929.1 protein XRI1 [Brachypodium distachyon]